MRKPPVYGFLQHVWLLLKQLLVVTECEEPGKQWKKIPPLSVLSAEGALGELRRLRESGVRDSEYVVKLWTNCLCDHNFKYSPDQWTVLEQVFIAALDVRDEKVAETCLGRLRDKFPESSRVRRLYAMYLESKGYYTEARSIYSALIEEDPSNTLVRKRLIPMLRVEGKTQQAIEELCNHVKFFMSDFEAWCQLGDMYLIEGDYKHAAFCYEEMILSNPHNHLYHQRYAELKYTQGGLENMELARLHFARACFLNPDNLRCLFGLLLTCSTQPGTLYPKHAITSHEAIGEMNNYSSPISSNDLGSISTSISSNSNSSGRAGVVTAPSGPLNGRNALPSSSSGLGSSDRRECVRLTQWAAQRISEIYSQASQSRTRQIPTKRSGKMALVGSDSVNLVNSVTSPASSTEFDRPVTLGEVQDTNPNYD